MGILSSSEFPGLGTPGKLHMGGMPLDFFVDPNATYSVERLTNLGIKRIVLLSPSQEVTSALNHLYSVDTLRELYERNKFQMVHHPIEGKLSKIDLRMIVDDVTDSLMKGKNVFLQGQNSQKRPAFIATCIARKVLGISGPEAIKLFKTMHQIDPGTFTQLKAIRDLYPTHIPFDNVSGNVYRSTVPHGIRRDNGATIMEMKALNVDEVVMLCSIDEGQNYTQCNLIEKYEREGFGVTYFPIPDFDVPEFEQFTGLIQNLHDKLVKGRNLLVHCVGGHGRTGLVLASLARKIKGLSGEEALKWVRTFVPKAVETPDQERFVKCFIEGPKNIDPPRDSKNIIRIPLQDVPGMLFRGTLPMGILHNPDLFKQQMQDRRINKIVMLCTPQEGELATGDGIPLREIYDQLGYQVKHLPIPDGGLPQDQVKFRKLISDINKDLLNGKNIYVHCRSGNGRTGMVIASVLGRIEYLNGNDAITQVRRCLPFSCSDQKQNAFVRQYLDGWMQELIVSTK